MDTITTGCDDQDERRRKRIQIKQFLATNRLPKFEWGGVFEGYAKGYIARNFWRVAETLGSQDDALQEAAIVFLRCKRLYEGKIDNPKWMMALFKSALAMEFNTISQKSTKYREVIAVSTDETEWLANTAIPEKQPSEVEELIEAVLNSPAELLEIIFSGADMVKIQRRIGRIFNQYLRTKFGIAPGKKIDLQELMTR